MWNGIVLRKAFENIFSLLYIVPQRINTNNVGWVALKYCVPVNWWWFCKGTAVESGLRVESGQRLFCFYCPPFLNYFRREFLKCINAFLRQRTTSATNGYYASRLKFQDIKIMQLIPWNTKTFNLKPKSVQTHLLLQYVFDNKNIPHRNVQLIFCVYCCQSIKG